MKKVNTKRSILTVTIIAAVLLVFSVNVNANSSTQVSDTQVCCEIIDMDGDLKCGEAEGKTKAKTDKKAKETESKCGEAEGKAAVKSDKKSTESKCGEGKCGEGKCGTDEKKTEAKSDKNAKSTEAKCGEGKVM